MPSTVNQYLVIHKKCENPELVIQILNDSVVNEYGLSDTAAAGIYPLSWECDFADEIEYTYEVLKQSMGGNVPEDAAKEYSAHKFLHMDLSQLTELNQEPLGQFGLEDWKDGSDDMFIRLYGIITGAEPIAEGSYVPVENLYFGQTETMKRKWNYLQEEENRILGEEPIEAFDMFVEKWEREGGLEIQNEVIQAVSE